ncbi:MAG: hypothetical protein K2M17_04695 [Bacilli bacterium]|nr:hypothetical protein [Bacilli bacterium]
MKNRISILFGLLGVIFLIFVLLFYYNPRLKDENGESINMSIAAEFTIKELKIIKCINHL